MRDRGTTSMKKGHQNIGIVAFPICEVGNVSKDTKAGSIPFSNLVDILHRFSDNLYVITGNKERVLFKKDDKMHVFEVQHKGGAGFVGRIMNYVFTQLRLSFKVAKLSRRVNLWFFFIGAEGLVLPVMTARLLRRPVVLALTGFTARVSEVERVPLFNMVDLLVRLSLVLSNGITVCSERVIAEYNLERYRHKISVAHEFSLDFDKFKKQKQLHQRANSVGYIGRFTEVKGILNFIEAIPRVLESLDNVGFLIGGDGPLRGRVEEYLTRENLNSRVNFVGWIPHDELPNYLNNLKLLVLPSYSESLSFITREAIACGTLVLATAVGGIPDVIKDGITGFIMEDNSADCIARNIIRALSYPNLEQIAENAHTLVQKEYRFEVTMERYESVLARFK